MAQILIDTDVLISVLRGMEMISRRMEELQGGGNQLGYSAVTVAELWHGLRPKEETPTRRLLSQMECFPVSDAIGRLAGQYLQRFQRSHGLTLSDALIAATAVLSRSSLWTLNKRHFPMSDLPVL